MKKETKINLLPIDELFTTEEQRQDDKLERVREVAINELQPFNNHPFQVKNDDEMKHLCDSILEYGILTLCQVGTKLRSDIELAEKTDDSARTIQRYIRLTELVKPILDLVDSKRIAFSPAVELSYLTKEEQAELWAIVHIVCRWEEA